MMYTNTQTQRATVCGDQSLLLREYSRTPGEYAVTHASSGTVVDHGRSWDP
jgi:hypothetical protein